MYNENYYEDAASTEQIAVFTDDQSGPGYVAVASEESGPDNNDRQVVVNNYYGSGTGKAGSGASDGSTLLWVLAAIVVALLLFTITPSLLDWLKDIINQALGGDPNQGTGWTGSGTDPVNPGVDESDDDLSYTVAQTGFLGVKDSAPIRAALAAPISGEGAPISFDNKGHMHFVHDLFYYDSLGRLVIETCQIGAEKFADKADNSWKSWILQFVSMGAYTAVVWTLPLQMVVLVEIQSDTLGPCEMLWTGSVAQAGQNQFTRLLRDGYAITSGQMRLGNCTIVPKANLQLNYKFADTEGWKKTAFDSAFIVKNADAINQWQRRRLSTMIARYFDHGDTDPFRKNLPTKQIASDDPHNGAEGRAMAASIVEVVNGAYQYLLDQWTAEGQDPANLIYSIPGAIAPTVPIPRPEYPAPSLAEIWSRIKSGALHKQAWLWTVINNWMCVNEHSYDGSDVQGARFYLCAKDANSPNTMFLCDAPGSSATALESRAVFCWFAYMLYEPLSAVFSQSLWTRSRYGQIWGPSVWVPGTASTQGVANSGLDAVIGSIDVSQLTENDIDPDLVAQFCMPMTSTWFKQGAPTAFTSHANN